MQLCLAYLREIAIEAHCHTVEESKQSDMCLQSVSCQELHIPQIVWSRQKHSIQEEPLDPPTKVGSKSSQRAESLKDYANGEGITHKGQVSPEWKSAPMQCALGLEVQIWPKFRHTFECPKISWENFRKDDGAKVDVCYAKGHFA